MKFGEIPHKSHRSLNINVNSLKDPFGKLERKKNNHHHHHHLWPDPNIFFFTFESNTTFYIKTFQIKRIVTRVQ